MGRRTYVQDPETGDFVLKSELHRKQDANQSARVHTFKEFQSPVDNTIIGDRKQLAAHNARHGVTNVQDYGDKYFERRGREKENERVGNNARAKSERRDLIRRTLHQHGY